MDWRWLVEPILCGIRRLRGSRRRCCLHPFRYAHRLRGIFRLSRGIRRLGLRSRVNRLQLATPAACLPRNGARRPRSAALPRPQDRNGKPVRWNLGRGIPGRLNCSSPRLRAHLGARSYRYGSSSLRRPPGCLPRRSAPAFLRRVAAPRVPRRAGLHRRPACLRRNCRIPAPPAAAARFCHRLGAGSPLNHPLAKSARQHCRCHVFVLPDERRRQRTCNGNSALDVGQPHTRPPVSGNHALGMPLREAASKRNLRTHFAQRPGFSRAARL